jgi:hypothetical protein
MADKTTTAGGAQQAHKVTFTCQMCQKSWDTKDMRRIFRFRPPLIVCPECEKTIR